MELPHAQINWEQDTPSSSDYGDVYYSKENGLDEARYVFLQSNGLPERLSETPHFVIGETGFGSGLNFLALWHAWKQLPSPRPSIHFITTEQHPMRQQDMKRAHAHWPELSSISNQLCESMPQAIAGVHSRWFEGGKIRLDILYGDAATMLSRYAQSDSATHIDAWFLDGFAPAQNPTMWHGDLYQAMAKLSRQGTTLATFTAAGDVRRGLESAGFEVKKHKGYGHKRDMVVGYFSSPSYITTPPSHAIVVGAGIAGIAAAWRLAKRNIKVTILEAGDAVCQGASGNPASAFTPFYPKKWDARGRLLASSVDTTRHLLSYLQSQGHSIRHQLNGTLMLNLEDASPRSTRLKKWQESLRLPDTIRRIVNADIASDIAQTPLTHGGWFYPHGGWIHMGDMAHTLLADAQEHITVICNAAIQTLEHKNNQWHLTAEDGSKYSSEHVVVANAHAAKTLLPELALEAVHGQTIHFQPPAAWQSLACTIHAGHTLIPLAPNSFSWGASFRHHIDAPDIQDEDSILLLEDLHAAFPNIEIENVTAWAGLRCTHPSRMPLLGQMPNQPDGLYLHLAHGARGLLTGLASCIGECYA